MLGHSGVRVLPEARAAERPMFEFMASSVSTEKPKGIAIREIARELIRARSSGGRTLLVGGPAIIHTGSGDRAEPVAVDWRMRRLPKQPRGRPIQ